MAVIKYLLRNKLHKLLLIQALYIRVKATEYMSHNVKPLSDSEDEMNLILRDYRMQ